MNPAIAPHCEALMRNIQIVLRRSDDDQVALLKQVLFGGNPGFGDEIPAVAMDARFRCFYLPEDFRVFYLGVFLRSGRDIVDGLLIGNPPQCTGYIFDIARFFSLQHEMV